MLRLFFIVTAMAGGAFGAVPSLDSSIRVFKTPPIVVYCFSNEGVEMVRRPILQSRWLENAETEWSTIELLIEEQKLVVLGPEAVEGAYAGELLNGIWEIDGNQRKFLILPDGRCWTLWQEDQPWQFYGYFSEVSVLYHPSLAFATVGRFAFDGPDRIIFSESRFVSGQMIRSTQIVGVSSIVEGGQ